jgi:transcription elongation factor Elf1
MEPSWGFPLRKKVRLKQGAAIDRDSASRTNLQVGFMLALPRSIAVACMKGNIIHFIAQSGACMADDSHLDQKYFVDSSRYNCPYCNRRHVVYMIDACTKFDWTDEKECHVFFVKCSSCEKRSMHLTYQDMLHYSQTKSFKVDLEFATSMDENIFYSVPSSFHVIDERIPRIIRELLDEAQGCLKSNFLTGASACVRKVVYELARLQKADGSNYDGRIQKSQR